MTNYVALAVNLIDNILYMYKFLRYVNFEDATIQHFCDYILRITSPLKIHRFHEHSLTNVLHMHMTSSLINYLLLSRIRSRSPHLATRPRISDLMYQN